MDAALDCTLLLPIRDAAGAIERGALHWLAGCPHPIHFAVDPVDHDTISALEAWLDRTPVPGTLLRQRRPRLSGALNDALQAVTTRYVHWCGLDDQAYWRRYPAVMHAIGASSPAWIVGRCDTARAGGGPALAGIYRNLLHRTTRWTLPFTNVIGCPAVIFRADRALAVGGFDEKVAAAMDYDLWMRLFAVERPVVVPFALGQFTVTRDSLTRAHRSQSIGDCYAARRRYFRQAWIADLARLVQSAQLKVQDLTGE